MADTQLSFGERWIANISRYSYVLYLALVLEALLLALAVASLLGGQHDEATRTILLLDLALIGVAMALTVGIIALCRRFHQ